MFQEKEVLQFISDTLKESSYKSGSLSVRMWEMPLSLAPYTPPLLYTLINAHI